ncbi:hypothetical protein NKJ36_17660 [Mesorhizobium sp. M0142]|nr:hypothetical protein [Mesorhizobium sp. LSHC420B00]
MLRRIRQCDPRKLRQLLDGQFAIGNVTQQNQPVGMPQGAGEIRYFVEDRVVNVRPFHMTWLALINQSINMLND